MDNSTDAAEMSRAEKRRDYMRDYHRKWYAENRERVLAQRRERYRNDPNASEKVMVACKKWRGKNPEMYRKSQLRHYVNALRREGYTVIPPEGVEA